MSEIRQTPIPEKAMTGYQNILRRETEGDGWRMVFYVRDSFGRSWSTEVKVRAPELGLGEEVFPHEWSDGGA